MSEWRPTCVACIAECLEDDGQQLVSDWNSPGGNRFHLSRRTPSLADCLVDGTALCAVHAMRSYIGPHVIEEVG